MQSSQQQVHQNSSISHTEKSQDNFQNKQSHSQISNSDDNNFEKRNFMFPQNQNGILDKREKFAINLRKKKTKEIVIEKRRKIMECFNKGQVELSNINSNDDELSIQFMQQQFYQGYPLWRKQKYQIQKQIIDYLSQNQNNYQNIQNYDINQNIQYYLNILKEQPNLQILEQLALLTQVRQLTSQDQYFDILKMIEKTNILEIVGKILTLDENQSQIDENGESINRYLKLEATWILTNIGNGDETVLKQVLSPKYQIFDNINKILKSEDLQMIEQVIWFLSNTAGESSLMRKIVIQQTCIIDSIVRILSFIKQKQIYIRKSLIQNIAWCVSNLSFYGTGKHLEQARFNDLQKQKLIYIFTTILENESEMIPSTILDTFRGLNYLAEQCDDNIMIYLCQNNILMNKLVKYLKSPLDEENSEAIKLSGTILSVDSSEGVDLFIQNHGIQALGSHLNNQTCSSKIKQVLWAISNISAGSTDQIKILVSNEDLISNIIKLMDCNVQNIQRESIIIFTNIFQTCNEPNLLSNLIRKDNFKIFKNLISSLKIFDINLQKEILQSFNQIFNLDYQFEWPMQEQIIYNFEILGGVDAFEELQKHPNQQIYDMVQDLINQYFQIEDQEPECRNMVSQSQASTCNSSNYPYRQFTI